MTRMALALICLASGLAVRPAWGAGPEEEVKRVVGEFFDNMDAGKAADTVRLFTRDGKVVGVPDENPQRAWTRSPKDAVMRLTDCWNGGKVQLGELHTEVGKNTAAVLVPYKLHHIEGACAIELVQTNAGWRIDRFRFTTRVK